MALFGKKKRYVAKFKDSEEFYQKGIDTQKYDVPKMFRDLMEEIIKKLFNNESIDFTEYYNRILNKSASEYVVLKRFNKPKDAYKVMPQHLRALRWTEKYIGISEETERARLVGMLFVHTNGKFAEHPTDVMIYDDIDILPEGIKIDYDKYFEFFLIQKMQDLYDVFNVNYPELKVVKKIRTKYYDSEEGSKMLRFLEQNAVFTGEYIWPE